MTPEIGWSPKRRPEDDAECERLGCEDRTHPVWHRAAPDLRLVREALGFLEQIADAPVPTLSISAARTRLRSFLAGYERP